MSLTEVERFVSSNKHLPEVPSASEMADEGLHLKEMNLLLLKKIEEVTLYLIQQHKINAAQADEIELLKSEVARLKEGNSSQYNS